MISMLRLGKGVAGTCGRLYRFDSDEEGEVELSTTVPLPVGRAGRRKGKGCRWFMHMLSTNPRPGTALVCS